MGCHSHGKGAFAILRVGNSVNEHHVGLQTAIWECVSLQQKGRNTHVIENHVISHIHVFINHLYGIENKPWFNFFWGGGAPPPPPPVRQSFQEKSGLNENESFVWKYMYIKFIETLKTLFDIVEAPFKNR